MKFLMGSNIKPPGSSELEPGLLANPAVWTKIAPDGQPQSGGAAIWSDLSSAKVGPAAKVSPDGSRGAA